MNEIKNLNKRRKTRKEDRGGVTNPAGQMELFTKRHVRGMREGHNWKRGTINILQNDTIRLLVSLAWLYPHSPLLYLFLARKYETIKRNFLAIRVSSSEFCVFIGVPNRVTDLWVRGTDDYNDDDDDRNTAAPRLLSPHLARNKTGTLDLPSFFVLLEKPDNAIIPEAGLSYHRSAEKKSHSCTISPS